MGGLICSLHQVTPIHPASTLEIKEQTRFLRLTGIKFYTIPLSQSEFYRLRQCQCSLQKSHTQFLQPTSICLSIKTVCGSEFYRMSIVHVISLSARLNHTVIMTSPPSRNTQKVNRYRVIHLIFLVLFDSLGKEMVNIKTPANRELKKALLLPAK